MRGMIFIFVATLLKRLSDEIVKERELSRTDPVTGIGNSRYFFELFRRETARVARYHRPMAVVYIDVDDFKRVNEPYVWG
jgi:diguanylate cyclase (GGDEF)-like protein